MTSQAKTTKMVLGELADIINFDSNPFVGVVEIVPGGGNGYFIEEVWRPRGDGWAKEEVRHRRLVADRRYPDPEAGCRTTGWYTQVAWENGVTIRPDRNRTGEWEVVVRSGPHYWD